MCNEQEQNNNYAEKHECLCKKEWLRKFLIIFLSVYFGVLFAMCTFHAIHSLKFHQEKNYQTIYRIYDNEFENNQMQMLKKEMDKMRKDMEKEFFKD